MINRNLRWIVFAAYLAVVIFTAAHHEMWRDEVRALSLARDTTLRDLFSELRFEGHPAIWYLLLRGATMVTASSAVLPVLSLVAAAAAVYLILRCAPFGWPQKILLIAGVFPLFEYSVVARNYGIGMLLILLLAHWYPTRLERPLRWGLVLAILANTSAHAAVIAAAILVGTGWDFLAGWRQQSRATIPAFNVRRVWFGAAIAFAGLIAARATVSTNRLPDFPGPMPRAQTIAHQMGLTALNPGRDLGALLPSPVAPLGNSHGTLQRSTLQSIAIDGVLLAMLVALWGEWSLLLTVFTAVVGNGALFRTVYGARMRHIGLLWFVLVLAWWELARRPDVSRARRRAPRPHARRSSARRHG